MYWPLIYKAHGRLHDSLMSRNRYVYPHVRVTYSETAISINTSQHFQNGILSEEDHGPFVLPLFFLGGKRGEVKFCILDNRDNSQQTAMSCTENMVRKQQL